MTVPLFYAAQARRERGRWVCTAQLAGVMVRDLGPKLTFLHLAPFREYGGWSA